MSLKNAFLNQRLLETTYNNNLINNDNNNINESIGFNMYCK